MKIAIHNSNKGDFKDHWIKYCKDNNICYKLVNAYDCDIISQLSDCDIFMWQHYQRSYKDKLFAKQLMFALQIAGKKVFPDFNTCWHFDDKIGQKYLLEAIGAPLVPSYVFYSKPRAINWARNTNYPKVFKLRGGASSINVKLVKSKKLALNLINKAFEKGFSQYNWRERLSEAWRKYKSGKAGFRDLLRPIYKRIKKYPTVFSKYRVNEKGYVYFQDFIPDNRYDIRLIVINGERAYGMKRKVRPNDFRASGSENFDYSFDDKEILKTSFQIANRLKLQSVAFDYIYDKNNKPLIVELSYAFGTKGSGKCSGYWDKNLQWHEGPFDPYGWMIELLLKD